MKLNKGFLTYVTDGEQLMVATDTKKFSGLVRSNKTAADIVDCLKKDSTKEEIIQTMLEKYEVDEKRLEEDVEKVLEILRGIGALDE